MCVGVEGGSRKWGERCVCGGGGEEGVAGWERGSSGVGVG